MKKTSQKDFKRFDMSMKVKKQRLMPIIKLLSYPGVKKHKVKVTKINTEGLKPPYLLLVNHNAFLDFKVVESIVLPNRTNSVVAIDGFIKREWLLRRVGCICKRKFTQDITLIRRLHEVIKMGDIAVLYPEARYSLCGTNALLPSSLGKLVKNLKVPLVTIITKGHHINSPFWNLHDNNIPTEATMKQVLTKEEIESLDAESINQMIEKEFQYDDFKWQKDNQIKNTYTDRAKGLHKVLYQCPHCKEEYYMESDKNEIWCNKCGKKWIMSEYGELSALEGKTEFSHIPDWYEWERENVKKEIEEGKYYFESTVRVDSLPNSKGYINLGLATLYHDKNGFRIKGIYNNEEYEVLRPVNTMYSVHIEYEYLGKYGDCVDINTLTDTYYCYPQDRLFSVTKLALATEELYKKECPKGIITLKDNK